MSCWRKARSNGQAVVENTETTPRKLSWLCRTKTGHRLSGQYLSRTRNRPTRQCWWYRYPTQTREHLFKVCPEWKGGQKILWAEARKETRRWKDRWKIRDRLVDERCGRAVPEFLSTTDVGWWAGRGVCSERGGGDGAVGVGGGAKGCGRGAWHWGGSYRCCFPRRTS